MTSQPTIIFLDASTVDLGDLDLSSIKRQGRLICYSNSTKKQMIERIQKADIIITNKCVIDPHIVDKAGHLKLVCAAATGTNHIASEYLKTLGIGVCNVPGYSTATVAEHTILFLLVLTHRLYPHHEAAMNGTWSRSDHFTVLDFPFYELRGKTLGIIGYGAIGKEVARMAKIFGMKISLCAIPGIIYPKSEKRVPLKSFLKQSDVVTIHCPLTKQTKNLINSQTIGWMKKGAYLMNLARGPIVDSKSVALALKKGIIAGFATDVLENEPPPSNHPLFDKSFHGQVIITPHVAWASREARQRLVDEMAKNISAFKMGKKRNRVA